MQKRPLKDSKGKTERIEVRLSTELREALSEYSSRNLETIMETTNRAIKAYVGFGEQKPLKPVITNEGDLPKKDRLEIRLHPQLKKMLLDAKNRIGIDAEGNPPKISAMVISAIIQYIGFSEVSGK
jgi:hypothetical protein